MPRDSRGSKGVLRPPAPIKKISNLSPTLRKLRYVSSVAVFLRGLRTALIGWASKFLSRFAVSIKKPPHRSASLLSVAVFFGKPLRSCGRPPRLSRCKAKPKRVVVILLVFWLLLCP
ncbi:hypothetical protein [Capnocytophaga canis]|uniref:hypothetical protein n=1 Tax=Capnocytophaga canis TaxID=1848903 RepID=UPI0015628FBF|nr:hypothetical protein [Capnocytophaga canis]